MKKILILLLFVPLFSNAIKYYVSAAGSNSNNGTSTGTSWLTLAKVSGSSFNPGDSILFNRGDTWTGGLVVPSAGSSGNNIFFGAYGSGAKPIFTQRIVLPGWSTSGNWTSAGTNIYYISLNVPQWPRLWLNGTEQTRSQTSGGVNSTDRYFYNTTTDRLYVYATSNPASFYSLMEIPTAGSTYTVRLANFKNYVTLQNLDIRGGQYSLLIEFCDHIIIEDCNIGLDCGYTGIAGDECDDVTIRRCTIDSGDRLLDTWNYDTEPSLQDGIRAGGNCDGWKIYQNTVKDWAHVNIYLTNFSGGTLNNHEIYENYVTSSDVDYCAPVAVESAVGGGSSTGNKIYRNFFDGNKGWCILNSPGLIFMYNIVNGTTKPTWATSKIAYGIGINGYNSTNASDMIIVNNIISNNEEAGMLMSRPTGYEQISGNIISNNIFYNNGTSPYGGTNSGIQFYSDDQVSYGANTFQNNVFYKSGVTSPIINAHATPGSETSTVAQFKATNGNSGDVISGNIQADPLFVNGASNWELQSTSPAINNGGNLGTNYQVGVSSGSTWPTGVITATQTGSWDIGVYVYQITESFNGLKIQRNVRTQ